METKETKVPPDEESKLNAKREQMRDDRHRVAWRASEMVQVLDEMAEHLARIEKRNADLTGEIAHLRSREEQVLRQLQAARAALGLAENKERALKERRRNDESRIRVLEKRVAELLRQRAEVEKELEVTRSAVQSAEATLHTLCDLQRRTRAGHGRPTCGA